MKLGWLRADKLCKFVPLLLAAPVALSQICIESPICSLNDLWKWSTESWLGGEPNIKRRNIVQQIKMKETEKKSLQASKPGPGPGQRPSDGDDGDDDDVDGDDDDVGGSGSLLGGNINTQLAKQLRTGCWHVAGVVLLWKIHF